jgi:hypothetical protein
MKILTKNYRIVLSFMQVKESKPALNLYHFT